MTATIDHTPSTTTITTSTPQRRPQPRLARLVMRLRSRAALAATVIRVRAAEARADEAGNVITDNLAWIVFGVIAIVAMGALISGLGSQVMTWVTKQLGVG